MRISQFSLFTFTCPEVWVSRINAAHPSASKAPAAWERRGSSSRGYKSHSLGGKCAFCFQGALLRTETYHDRTVRVFSSTLKPVYLRWRLCNGCSPHRQNTFGTALLCFCGFEYTCKYNNLLDKCQCLWAAPNPCDGGIQGIILFFFFYCTRNVFCVVERFWCLRDIRLF